MAVSKEGYERLQREVEVLRSENEEKNVLLVVAATEAATYREDFENERRDRETVHAKLETFRRESQMNIMCLVAQIEHLSKEGAELREARDEIKAKEHQILRYKEQMEQLNSQVSQLQQHNRELNQEMRKVRIALEQAKAGQSRTADDVTNDSLKSELEKLQTKCDYLQNENEAMHQVRLKLTEHNKHLQKANGELVEKLHATSSAVTPSKPVQGEEPLIRAKLHHQDTPPQVHQATPTSDLEQIRMQLKQNFKRHNHKNSPNVEGVADETQTPPLHSRKRSSENHPLHPVRVPSDPQASSSQSDLKEMPYARGSSYPPSELSLQPQKNIVSGFDPKSITYESTPAKPTPVFQNLVPATPEEVPGTNYRRISPVPNESRSSGTATPVQSLLPSVPPALYGRSPYSSSPNFTDTEDNEDLLPNQLMFDIETEIEEVADDVRLSGSATRRTNIHAPYDPNLVCPQCGKKFRIGEIQKLKRHVSKLCLQPQQTNTPESHCGRSQKLDKYGYVNVVAETSSLIPGRNYVNQPPETALPSTDRHTHTPSRRDQQQQQVKELQPCIEFAVGGGDSEEEELYLSGDFSATDNKGAAMAKGGPSVTSGCESQLRQTVDAQSAAEVTTLSVDGKSQGSLTLVCSLCGMRFNAAENQKFKEHVWNCVGKGDAYIHVHVD